tara:strand:+ start:2887 stop:3162 length:276 start_codon:yes stop_codon:yes gene_type:complete
MFVVKINDEKGTVTVCDVPLTSKEFDVDGYKCTTSSGEQPNKFGWFRVSDFFNNMEKIKSHFTMGKDISKFIEFGECNDVEMKLFTINPTK